MRGRNNSGGGGNNNNQNNNRKGPNPLTRNYESNGPDVKIRGSAQQIAEKYATLARDASSAGDRVMAENYLQHAEHYNRIIAAAQAQFATQQVHTPRDDDDDLDDDAYEAGSAQPEQSQPTQTQAPQHQARPPVDGSGPQPVIEGMPAEVALNSQAVGQPAGGGGRNRERRHNNHHQHNGNAAPAAMQEQAPVAAAAQPVAEAAEAPAAAPATEAAAEEAPRPRRGRRPRRERGAEDGGAQPQAASEGGSGELATSET
jgi:hypothetical protein